VENPRIWGILATSTPQEAEHLSVMSYAARETTTGLIDILGLS